VHSICLPAALERIDIAGLYWPCITHLTVEPGNQHFDLSGSYLLDFAGVSIVGHIGPATELCIGNAIRELCDGCFACQTAISTVSFEADCGVRRFGDRAFCNSSLRSIVVPSSVEVIESGCFWGCTELSIVAFEPNSRLSSFGEQVFACCTSLKRIALPAAIQTTITDQVVGWSTLEIEIIETGAIVSSLPE
jgi:hypothetical protein